MDLGFVCVARLDDLIQQEFVAVFGGFSIRLGPYIYIYIVLFLTPPYSHTMYSSFILIKFFISMWIWARF